MGPKCNQGALIRGRQVEIWQKGEGDMEVGAEIGVMWL